MWKDVSFAYPSPWNTFQSLQPSLYQGKQARKTLSQLAIGEERTSAVLRPQVLAMAAAQTTSAANANQQPKSAQKGVMMRRARGPSSRPSSTGSTLVVVTRLDSRNRLMMP